MPNLAPTHRRHGGLQVVPGASLPCAADAERTGGNADERWIVLDSHATPLARCSLWWTRTPKLSGERVGYIGHYLDESEAAAGELLRHACGRLRDQGCCRAIGPIDGTTWNTYRFVTAPGDYPAFFGEPQNPAAWPDHLRANGFTEIAEYTSAVDTALYAPYAGETSAGNRLADAGISIRSLDLGRIEQDLPHIHKLACRSFRNNFLFQPIEIEGFSKRYRRLLSLVQTDMVLLAEADDRLVGFLFGLPEQFEVPVDPRPRTAIIRTLAIEPTRAYAGLGRLLFAKWRRLVHQLGYDTAIYAMMPVTSRSQALTARCAKTIRRYAVFEKVL